jgi:eukaryotic-like serine/threonine-protein kinase
MPACKACGNSVGDNDIACAACGTPVGGPKTLLTKGETFDGKYEVLDFLGAGGMGELYKVKHIHLQDTRVIKIMRATMAQSEADTKRFISEARIATRIHHPCVSVLYDFSQLPTGNFYMVWEYIPGKDISRVLQGCGRMPLPLAVRIMRDALDGLDHVHKNGVIHRDISPENLMLYLNTFNELKVKIIDLGIAKSFAMSEHLTQTGMFMGKLKYCSPEQVGMLEEGEQIDGRTDIYSIGLVLYEMVEGHAPFTSTTPYGYIHKHITTAPAPISLPDIAGDAGDHFNAVLMKALEKDRNRRYGTALEFAEALASLNLPPPDAPVIHGYLKPVGFETAHITTPATGSRAVKPPQQQTPARTPSGPSPAAAPASGAAPKPAPAAKAPSGPQPRPAPDATRQEAISDDTDSRPTRRTPPPASAPQETPDRTLMGLEQTFAPDKNRRVPVPAEPTLAAPRAKSAPVKVPEVERTLMGDADQRTMAARPAPVQPEAPPPAPPAPAPVEQKPEQDRTLMAGADQRTMAARPAPAKPKTPPPAKPAPVRTPVPVAPVPEPVALPAEREEPAPVLRERKRFPMVLLAVPVLLILAVAAVFLLTHRTAHPAQPPSKQTAAGPTGSLSLHVLPWGKISSLRNEKGADFAPANSVTPLHLPLPEGRYTAVIAVGRTSKALTLTFGIRAGETTELVRSVADSSYETFLAQIR